MQHLGIDGYVGLVESVLANADAMRAGIAEIDGLHVLGDGGFQLIAMANDPGSDVEIDVFALGDALVKRRWYHDRQTPPDSLHSTVSNTNAGVIEEYLADLRLAVGEVGTSRAANRSTTYATLE